MSRLTIDMTDHQHQSLKALAALQGKTIKEYTLERLFPDSKTEEQALSELRCLLEHRLARAKQGGVSDQTITEIARDTIRDRGAL